MPSMTLRAREGRVRRKLARLGYRLRIAPDRSCYLITDRRDRRGHLLCMGTSPENALQAFARYIARELEFYAETSRRWSRGGIVVTYTDRTAPVGIAGRHDRAA